MTMRALSVLCLASLLVVSPLTGAQTLDEANQAIEKKEYAKARDLLEKLAMQGNVEAEVRLADMYISANGIPRNAQRGIALYESAARKGNAQAQYFLATELIKGGLIAPDMNRAMALLRTSAKLKNPGAQVSLCMELSTVGSKHYDAVEGYAWCEVASAKSHKQAGEAGRRGKVTLERIKESMGADGVKAAEQRAASYAKLY